MRNGIGRGQVGSDGISAALLAVAKVQAVDPAFPGLSRSLRTAVRGKPSWCSDPVEVDVRAKSGLGLRVRVNQPLRFRHGAYIGGSAPKDRPMEVIRAGWRRVHGGPARALAQELVKQSD